MSECAVPQSESRVSAPSPYTRITGDDLRRAREAILSTFPKRSSLAMFVRDSLDLRLDQITSDDGLECTVFELLEWAEAQGRVLEMVRKAAEYVPGNPLLGRLALEWLGRRGNVVLTLPGDLSTFTPQRIQQVKEVLANLLEIDPQQIELLRCQEGSVKITLCLPCEKIERLLALFNVAGPDRPVPLAALRPLNLQLEYEALGLTAQRSAIHVVRTDSVTDHHTIAITSARFNRSELHQADLAGAYLTRADLAGADLAGADLAGAYLTRADLAGAHLTGAHLTGANLTGADLNRADLTDANLTGANLNRADLTRSHLTEANLAGAHLTEANLTGAYLTRADLTETNLTRADLAGAHLAGANLFIAHLTGADLTGANLTSADLAGAHLAGAYLPGAILAGAYLTRADLTEANLSSANLTGADLAEANLTSTNLRGAFYDSDTRWPHDVDPEARGAIRIDDPGSRTPQSPVRTRW